MEPALEKPMMGLNVPTSNTVGNEDNPALVVQKSGASNRGNKSKNCCLVLRSPTDQTFYFKEEIPRGLPSTPQSKRG